MRSIRQSLRLIGVVTLLCSLSLTVGALPALGAEPPACGPAQDGQPWTDPESGVTFICQYIMGFGWG